MASRVSRWHYHDAARTEKCLWYEERERIHCHQKTFDDSVILQLLLWRCVLDSEYLEHLGYSFTLLRGRMHSSLEHRATLHGGHLETSHLGEGIGADGRALCYGGVTCGQAAEKRTAPRSHPLERPHSAVAAAMLGCRWQAANYQWWEKAGQH